MLPRLLALVVLLFASFAARPASAEPPARAPTTTRIGAFVVSLSDISEAQRRFDITFWVWMLAPDTGEAIDPAKTLEITNAAATDRQHSVTTTIDGQRYSQVKFRAQIRAPLDFRHFPFDRHTLEVNLEDAERDARLVTFVPDAPANGRAALSISHELDPQDWAIGELSLTTMTQIESTSFGDPTQTADAEYSRAVLGIEITRRHSFRILLTLLLGTIMSSVVALFATLLPARLAPPRYTLLSSALFVCIANRLLVDSRLPAGSSLGLLDQMQLLTICALLLLTGVSLWITNSGEKRLTEERATQLSQRFGVGWFVALCAIEVALVLGHRASA